MKLSGFLILFIAITSTFIYRTQIAAEQSRELASVSDKKQNKEIFYTCTKEKEMRWMRISYLSSGKCKTVYSKNGNATEVAQAASYDKCEETINNVKKNLESGGYVCKEKTLLSELTAD